MLHARYSPNAGVLSKVFILTSQKLMFAASCFPVPYMLLAKERSKRPFHLPKGMVLTILNMASFLNQWCLDLALDDGNGKKELLQFKATARIKAGEWEDAVYL